MKRLLISLCAIALVGAGCLPSFSPEATPVSFQVANTYSNTEFGFAFDYAKEYDVNVRSADTRPDTYAGMDVDFFASFRDIIRDDTPTNIFRLYAIPKTDIDSITEALKTTGEAVEIVSVEDVQFQDIPMKKIENTTDLGAPKYHYVFDRADKTIIVSVFIGEITVAEPVIQTFRTIQ